MVAGYRELRDTQLCECNNGVLWSEAKGNWRYYAAWEFLYRLVKHEYNKRDSITMIFRLKNDWFRDGFKGYLSSLSINVYMMYIYFNRRCSRSFSNGLSSLHATTIVTRGKVSIKKKDVSGDPSEQDWKPPATPGSVDSSLWRRER